MLPIDGEMKHCGVREIGSRINELQVSVPVLATLTSFAFCHQNDMTIKGEH